MTDYEMQMLDLAKAQLEMLKTIHTRLASIDDGLARMQTLWAVRQDEMDRQRLEDRQS